MGFKIRKIDFQKQTELSPDVDVVQVTINAFAHK